MLNELLKGSARVIAAAAMTTAVLTLNTTPASAGAANSAMSISVQVIDRCQVSVSPTGEWISWGCNDAGFGKTTFTTSNASTDTSAASVVNGVEFVEVTY